MTPQEVYLECYERVGEVVHQVADGLTVEQSLTRIGPDANPIGWLLWHLARVEDLQVAQLGGRDEVYPAHTGSFTGDDGIGFGMTSAQVGAFRTESVRALTDYYDAVAAQSREVISALTDLDRVIDDRYDPPVTVAARLTSVLADVLQHAGQAAYAKGVLDS